MKVIVASKPFREIEREAPQPSDHDLLVRVEAISVNPVDIKKRKTAAEDTVLGWDAAGTVVAVGAAVTLFRPGDAVFYAGDVTRLGSNAQLQLVDERIVGPAPKNLSFAQAAAIPLTALTAYEAIFDRLEVSRVPMGVPKTLLVIGGAGGVGSMAIQLGKLAGLVVYATASRPESVEWCRQLGADHVLDHTDLLAAAERAGVQEFDYIFNTQDTAGYWEATAKLIRPEGRICSIVEATTPLNVTLLMQKSATFVWELMFTRSIFRRPEMVRQHETLRHVAALLESGALRTTVNDVLGPITAANLERAHEMIASRRSVGKLVLSGWQ